MEWERTYPDLLSSINEKELLNQLLKGGEYTTPLQLTSRADVYGGNRSTIYNWNLFPDSLIERRGIWSVTIGNSRYDWGYNYEENVADPHDFLCYGCDEGRNGDILG